jgi:hypothetical protein
MASALSSPSTTGSDDPAKIEILAQALYEAVAETDENRLWTQNDLLELNIIPGGSVGILVTVIQKLSHDFLFKPLRDSSATLCWKLRSEADAKTQVLLVFFCTLALTFSQVRLYHEHRIPSRIRTD